MAQLEREQRHTEEAAAAATSATVDQLLQGGEVSKVSSPSFGHQQKKSVLTKVKEKARKLRYSLSRKKYDENVTPSWGVSLDEDDEGEDDPEYLGAPMYESELAPEAYKENARQHPRASPVIPEEHVLASTGSLSPPPKMASPIYSTAPGTPWQNTRSTDQVWDNCISEKELEAGQDEKALSPADASSQYTTHTSTSTTYPIPVSPNACEASQEENHSRILQAN